MGKPAPFPRDAERLAVLESLPLGPATAARLREIVELAAYTAKTSMAGVSLLDAEQAYCEASIGFEIDCVPREESFAAHVIASGRPRIIPDTSADPDFADSPLSTGPTGMRFYAGFPITIDEHHVGTLFVADSRPREISPDDAHALRVIADQAVVQLKLARMRAGE